MCQTPLKAICCWPVSSGSCSRTERAGVACCFRRRRRGCGGGGTDALIWLDLAKIPNQGWSAVLVVSERLMLSLYHGNNLPLKPRKQISDGKDISRCHYGVIRRSTSIVHAEGRSVCVFYIVVPLISGYLWGFLTWLNALFVFCAFPAQAHARFHPLIVSVSSCDCGIAGWLLWCWIMNQSTGEEQSHTAAVCLWAAFTLAQLNVKKKTS